MSDLHELARLLRELDDQLVTCMRCGMCQAVCPLYAETGREADVARGKIVLLEHLSKELLKDPEAVRERLEKCLLCGSCASACPSGVRVTDLFLKARAIINGYLGLPPAKKALFRQILARPALFNKLAFMASKFQNILARPTGDIVGSSCARFESSLLGDRRFMPLDRKPFHRRIREIDEAAGAEDTRAAFFPGCLTDKVFPAVAESVVAALRHHDIRIFMPPDQACCGIPALSSGDTHAFTNLVRHNLKQFKAADFNVLVTPCATCTAVIKKVWPAMDQYFSPEEREAIGQLAEKTMDITQFLAAQSDSGEPAPKDGTRESRTRITYHDPCHLKKSLGVHAEPRALIGANPAYEFTEMEEADRCCGMGGSFGLQHYDLSKKVGERKGINITESNAEVVATSCPACMLQLIDLLSRSGSSARVKHAVEIYAEGLEP